MNIYGIIIAGGQGKRLWPLSRVLRPKPVLSITKGQSLIRQTLLRLNKIVETQNLIVVTNEEVFAPIYESIKEVSLENVISEPIGRNTAAAIGLACIHITQKHDDAIAIVSPADHYIEDDTQFSGLLQKAVEFSQKTDAVIVFGVKPTSPSVNYGYIAKGEKLGSDIFKVAKFIEKPPKAMAEQFVNEGYLWNAGIFVFRVSTMLNAIKQYMPELSSALEKIKKSFNGPYERKTIKEEYNKLNDISIDKGIIEKLDKTFVMEMTTKWADLGSFEQMANVMMSKDENGNQRMGNGIDIDSTNNIIVGEDTFVVTVSVHDLIIIVSDGNVLVTSKGSDESIVKAVNTLSARGLKEHI